MKTLIQAGVLFRAVSGEGPLNNQGILIENGAIKAVDTWHEFSTDGIDRFIDASNWTVMPALIDAHTHVIHSGNPDDPGWRETALTELPATTALKAARHARRHVEMGVLTIRDLGARDWVDVALRDAINAGWHVGPRMLVAGHGITTTGGHMDARKFVRPDVPASMLGTIGAIADSPTEARRAAREQLMRGADVIKLNATLSEYVRASGGTCSQELSFEAMRAICEVAHSTGRNVAAHCHGGPGVQAALDAGVDTFEHGRFLSDDLLDQMAERDVYLVPTISPEARRVDAHDPPQDPDDRRWYDKATTAMYQTVQRAYERGVNIVAGSDAAMPYVRHGEIAYEIYQLTQAGLSNGDALAAATRVAANALGINDVVGQVRAGYAADLIIVDGNPVRDVRCLQQREAILTVLQAGEAIVNRRDTV